MPAFLPNACFHSSDLNARTVRSSSPTSVGRREVRKEEMKIEFKWGRVEGKEQLVKQKWGEWEISGDRLGGRNGRRRFR